MFESARKLLHELECYDRKFFNDNNGRTALQQVEIMDGVFLIRGFFFGSWPVIQSKYPYIIAVTVDKNGEVYGFTSIPTINRKDCPWWIGDGREYLGEVGSDCLDWEDLLFINRNQSVTFHIEEDICGRWKTVYGPFDTVEQARMYVSNKEKQRIISIDKTVIQEWHNEKV